jgi:hypothetical protein
MEENEMYEPCGMHGWMKNINLLLIFNIRREHNTCHIQILME